MQRRRRWFTLTLSVLFATAALSAECTNLRAQEPLQPSPLIMAVDCDAQTSGLQYYCGPAEGATFTAAIVLQNITGEAVQFASVTFEIGVINALTPVDATPDTLDSNPDFNESDLGSNWACTTSLDINPDPGVLRTFMSCRRASGAATIPAGSSIELARVVRRGHREGRACLSRTRRNQ